MDSIPPCWGEVERRVRAQSSETAAPERSSGVGSNEVPLLRDEE